MLESGDIVECAQQGAFCTLVLGGKYIIDDLVSGGYCTLEGESGQHAIEKFRKVRGVMTNLKAAPTGGALKNDKTDNKAPLEFLRMDGIEEMCRVFKFGAKKYAKNNYLKGMESERLTSAALRHILAYQSGEKLDPESGRSHLGHAMACLAMHFSMESVGTLVETSDE